MGCDSIQFTLSLIIRTQYNDGRPVYFYGACIILEAMTALENALVSARMVCSSVDIPKPWMDKKRLKIGGDITAPTLVGLKIMEIGVQIYND